MAGVGHDRPQDWIVGVALLRAAIERLAIGGAKRDIEIKPGYKVRVADEGLAKRDEIGAPVRDGLVSAHFVAAVIGHEEPAEEPLDRQIVKGRNGGSARVTLDHMQVGETFTRQRRGDVVEQALRIAVSDVVLPVLRRDAHAGTLGTNRSRHRVDDLKQQPHTVLDAASISVRTLVGAIVQELIDQIAVRAMYLDTVEAGGKRVPRSLRILREPGISDVSSARGVGISSKPFAVTAFAFGLMADGAIGRAPPGWKEGWEMRPTCQSCSTMRPPPAWTALVTHFQPATCSAL